MIKGARVSTNPDYYIVTVGKKRYKAYSLRGCFRAANGRWPKEGELDQFLKMVVKIGAER